VRLGPATNAGAASSSSLPLCEDRVSERERSQISSRRRLHRQHPQRCQAGRPAVLSTKFEFVINRKKARRLGRRLLWC
jgi:hypothetical protein